MDKSKMSDVFELPLHADGGYIRDSEGMAIGAGSVYFTRTAIVRAVNAHDALVEALAAMVAWNGKRFGAFDELCGASEQPPEVQRALAALALAEGRS